LFLEQLYNARAYYVPHICTYINVPYQSYVLRWTIEGIPTLIDINRDDNFFIQSDLVNK